MATCSGRKWLFDSGCCATNTIRAIIVADARAFHAVWRSTSILIVFDVKYADRTNVDKSEVPLTIARPVKPRILSVDSIARHRATDVRFCQSQQKNHYQTVSHLVNGREAYFWRNSKI